MTSWTDRQLVADALHARAREVQPGRVIRTVIAAIGVAIGWAVARLLRSLGWLAGRAFLCLAFFAETVVFGFREGAGLPQPAAQEPPQKA
jgi:hypothetical protein